MLTFNTDWRPFLPLIISSFFNFFAVIWVPGSSFPCKLSRRYRYLAALLSSRLPSAAQGEDKSQRFYFSLPSAGKGNWGMEMCRYYSCLIRMKILCPTTAPALRGLAFQASTNPDPTNPSSEQKPLGISPRDDFMGKARSQVSDTSLPCPGAAGRTHSHPATSPSVTSPSPPGRDSSQRFQQQEGEIFSPR